THRVIIPGPSSCPTTRVTGHALLTTGHPTASEAEADLVAAENRAAEFGGSVDLTLFDGMDMLSAAWEAADDSMRRDLIRLAIDEISVTRGFRGKPFGGDERCVITWAKPSDD
ncbi:hypothetical protein ABT124_31620, partial [Streptomyces sp. NPDC001982]